MRAFYILFTAETATDEKAEKQMKVAAATAIKKGNHKSKFSCWLFLCDSLLLK